MQPRPLGLVWLGDALIYIVLPLYPAAFGIELAAVAVLLSANRVVRIIGYGWVSPLARRFGANALTRPEPVAAAQSPPSPTGSSPALRCCSSRGCVWGCTYGIINLTNTAYAYGDGQRAGTHIGLNRAVSTLGPVLAPRRWAAGSSPSRARGQVFVIYGVIGLLAVPLALQPAEAAAGGRRGAPSPPTGRWRPSALNILFFVVALGADGVFTATLSTLPPIIIPVTSALIGAGLLLAGQRMISVRVLWLRAGRWWTASRRGACSRPAAS